MARLSAEDWVRAATLQLAEGGVASVRVEPLAKTLGVSKGSFYWHFTDRAALLRAVVEGWERLGTLAIIEDVDREIDTPDGRLWALLERVFGRRGPLDHFESAVRAWAARDSDVQAVVRRVDRRRLRYVAKLLEAAGIDAAEARRRAELLYCVLIGEFFQCSYGKAKLSHASLRSLHHLMLAPA